MFFNKIWIKLFSLSAFKFQSSIYPKINGYFCISGLELQGNNWNGWKGLDGVGPLNKDPPAASFNTRSNKNGTCDIGNMTHDMCHMVPEKWGEVNHLSKCELPSSYSLRVKVFGRCAQNNDSFIHLLT